MSVQESSNKRIAKNTMFLYFRMMFTMVISLYTSRVILQTLGVTDYGIYQTVGGIVGFLSFINGALSTGSSRFLTFELGTGDVGKLKRTFSTTLTIHIALAVLVVVVAETAGAWFLYNKLEIPPERMEAAVYVFHISVLTSIFSLTQVPYGATIIAHENMSVYAYMSIVDVSLKLLVVYTLRLGLYDNLKFYATLLFCIQVGLMLFYRIYCYRKYPETHYKFVIDKQILKSIFGFSGWSLFANASIALNSQGILILLNMFFSPAVVAARAISIQVNMAANQFVSNFQTAASPQIVKRYAAGDYKGSKRLLLETTKYSFYLMWLLSLPICIAAEPLLRIWLGVIPEYTVIFLQLIVIQSLFQIFDTSFYRALYAKGQLRENALISPTLGFISFPLVYILFKMGFSPVALSWASLFTYAMLAFVVKPILIIRIVDYTWNDIWSVFLPCLKVVLISLPIPLLVNYIVEDSYCSVIWGFMIVVGVCVTSVLVSSWFIGLDASMRTKLVAVMRNRLSKN